VNYRASTSVEPDLHFLTLCTHLAEYGTVIVYRRLGLLLSAAYFKTLVKVCNEISK